MDISNINQKIKCILDNDCTISKRAEYYFKNLFNYLNDNQLIDELTYNVIKIRSNYNYNNVDLFIQIKDLIVKNKISYSRNDIIKFIKLSKNFSSKIYYLANPLLFNKDLENDSQQLINIHKSLMAQFNDNLIMIAIITHNLDLSIDLFYDFILKYNYKRNDLFLSFTNAFDNNYKLEDWENDISKLKIEDLNKIINLNPKKENTFNNVLDVNDFLIDIIDNIDLFSNLVINDHISKFDFITDIYNDLNFKDYIRSHKLTEIVIKYYDLYKEYKDFKLIEDDTDFTLYIYVIEKIKSFIENIKSLNEDKSKMLRMLNDSSAFDYFQKIIDQVMQFDICCFIRKIDLNNAFDMQRYTFLIDELSAQLNNVYIEKEYQKFEQEYKTNSDLTNDEENQYFIKFLESICKNKTVSINDCNLISPRYLLPYNFNHSNLEMLEFVKNNRKIVCNIALSTKLLIINSKLSGNGDYSIFITAQVKTIERLIKEILVQKFPNNIRNTNKNGICNPFLFGNINNLTADNLSKKHDNLNNSYALEFGSITLALFYALSNHVSNNYFVTDNHYNGIFKCSQIQCNPSNNIRFYYNVNTSTFYKYFVSGVRNGYFHIDTIDSIEDAINISKTTAYWMMRVIDEILDIYPNFKLR